MFIIGMLLFLLSIVILIAHRLYVGDPYSIENRIKSTRFDDV